MSKKCWLMIAVCGILLVGSLYWCLTLKGRISIKGVENIGKTVDVENEGVESIELERPPFLNNNE